MQLAIAAVAVIGVSAMLMGSRHRHVHRHAHTGVVVHRHRLGNQRADEDHPHGEQAQPSATGAPAVRAGSTADAVARQAHGECLSAGVSARVRGLAAGPLAPASARTTSTVTSPAFSKCRVNGKRLPSLSRLRSLGCIEHHMVGAGGEGQVLAGRHYHAGYLLHLHGTAGAHGMLVQLRVIADGAVDTQQAVIGLAIVVRPRNTRRHWGVGRQLQRPGVGYVQVAHAVFVGIGERLPGSSRAASGEACLSTVNLRSVQVQADSEMNSGQRQRHGGLTAGQSWRGVGW